MSQIAVLGSLVNKVTNDLVISIRRNIHMNLTN